MRRTPNALWCVMKFYWRLDPAGYGCSGREGDGHFSEEGCEDVVGVVHRKCSSVFVLARPVKAVDEIADPIPKCEESVE